MLENSLAQVSLRELLEETMRHESNKREVCVVGLRFRVWGLRFRVWGFGI